MIFSSKTGPSVPSAQLIDSNEENEMGFFTVAVITWTKAGQFPSALSGLIAQFLTAMPDWMNMTPEDLNLALESLPIPLEGHIPPGMSLH